MLKKFAKTSILFIFVFAFTTFLNTGWHPLRLFNQGFSQDWLPFQEMARMERLSKVLYLIQESYVDPERVNFPAMYESATDMLASRIAKLSIQHDSKKTVVLINGKKEEFPSDIETMFSLRNNLMRTIKFIHENAQPEQTMSDLEEVAIEGVLDTLDPHSNFLSEELFKEMQVGTSGKFGGLGIVIGMRESQLTVISPIDETPASKAGILAGDHITKIDDETTSGMTLNEAVEKMRGAKGSPVTITIERKGWTEAKDFKIIRDIIRVESVEYAILPSDIGWVKIKNFQEDTTKQLKKALSQLTEVSSNKTLKGLILDLRNNPGGLLDQAIEVSDLFLEQGTIVTTVGLKNKMRDSQQAEVKNTQPMYPIVVVVNEGSASASEIVAGALQRNLRAIVLGQKTFGKGTVQTLYDLPARSALKLTVAKYLTPGDISIQSIGIAPDIQTVPVVIDKEQITFFYSEEEHGEAELDRHFVNDQKPANMQPEASVEYLFTKPKPEDQEKEYSFNRLSTEGKQKRLLEDFENQISFDILTHTTGNTKKQLIDSAKKSLAVVNQKQQAQITAAMQKQGIDWSLAPKSKSPNNCKVPEVSFLVLPPTKDPVIHAGDKIELQAIMKNTGECTLYHAKATSDSSSGFFDHREIFFGKVAPGQSVSRKIPLTLPKYQPAGSYLLNFKFEESSNIAPKPQDMVISILPTKTPVFAFDYSINDQIESQSGFLSPNNPERGEKFYFNLKIKNLGEMASKETFVSIKPDGEKLVQLDKGREKIQQFMPNQEKAVRFLVSVPQKFDEPTFDLIVTISDTDFQSFIQKKVKIKLFQARIAEPKEEKVVQHFEEPVVSINNLAQLTKLQPSKITLEGVVKDDVAVQDMYIMVNGKKAIYHAFSDKNKSENFSLQVPLKKGKNEVVVVARDDQDLVQTVALNILGQ